MGLKERLLARRAEAGNTGNTGNEDLVTGKAVTEQNGNTGNAGNTGFGDGRAETATTEAAGGEDLRARPLLDSVTLVTDVTALENKGGSGNKAGEARVTRVTSRDVARFRPPADSIVSRINAAGGATSIGGHRADGSMFKHAWLPAGTDPAFVEELHAGGWTTSDREATEAYVAQCWRRAGAALTNVTDADRGEVADDT